MSLPSLPHRTHRETPRRTVRHVDVRHFVPRLGAAALALVLLGACATESMNQPLFADFAVGGAFNTVPAGTDLTSTSYASTDADEVWTGPLRGFMGGGGFGGRGMRGGPGMEGLMGGGLLGDFRGDGAIGRGPHRGAFGVRIDSTCTVSAGDVTCTSTRNGLTATTIYSITSLTGTTQTAIDTLTTNAVRTRTTVTGTTTRSGPRGPGRDTAAAPTVTATVNNSSDRSVTGLAPSSTQRTITGWSRSNESLSGTNREGETFTAVRTAGDTTKSLVVPVSTGNTPSYPKSGSVVRYMTVQTTVTGGSTTTNSRKEVLTYDGSATATLVITENGTTKNCTVALPRGRPSCQ